VKKYLQYAWYVLRHKWFVFMECCKLGIPWQGVIHDLSKFRPDEFVPYARHFYGRPKAKDGYIKSEDRGDLPMDLAWLKHQHRNPHHWQYWLPIATTRDEFETLQPHEMPDNYRREMLADWKGAGRAQGRTMDGECQLWYQAHKSKIALHPDTQKWIEEQLDFATWTTLQSSK
jgi:hypothetical protein